MIINTVDAQTVGETSSVLWSTLQSGPVDMLVILKNSGVNTLNYDLQQWTGTAWVDMDVLGTDYQNTLSANQVKSIHVVSSYPQVQCIGWASGGAIMEISITRYANRASGAAFPVLNL